MIRNVRGVATSGVLALVALLVYSLSTPREQSLALRSIALVLVTVGVSLPWGVVLVTIVTRTALPCRRLIDDLLTAWCFVPLVVQATAWQAGWGLTGIWSSLVPRFAIEGFTAAATIHVLAATPWTCLIVARGLRHVPRELEESALLRMSAWQVIVRVTWPAAGSSIALAALWTALWVFGEMTVTDLFAVRTLAEELYADVAIGEVDGPPLGRTLPVLMALVGASLWWLALRRLPEPRHVQEPSQRAFPLGRLAPLIGLFMLVSLAVLVVFPVASLAAKAGIVVTPTDVGITRSWSLVKCATLVASSPLGYAREIGASAALVGCVVLVTLPLALVMTVCCREERRSSQLMLLALACLAALPGPVVGLLTIELVNQPRLPWLVWLYDHTLLAPTLALTTRAVPWATWILMARRATIPRALDERLRLQGATTLERWRWLFWPELRGAVGLATLLVAWIVWSDLAASVLVVPPGVETLTIRTFGLLHYGAEDQLAGIALAEIVVFTASAAAGRRWSYAAMDRT